VLSEPERAALRRLGIFMGGFTLDAACAVVADPGLLKGDVVDAVAELAEKSLAVAETTETEPRLRLLETTRAYALERLAESGEREAVAHRHAEYYRNLSSALRVKRRRGPRANGWPIMLGKSTICVPRSTGPFRQAAKDRLGWPWPPPRSPSGCGCRCPRNAAAAPSERSPLSWPEQAGMRATR
jgi:hypothetical protein